MSTDTLTDNELIAEFMGRKYGQNADRNGYLKYDTSWDHLMPVVEKIEKETNYWFVRKPGSISIYTKYPAEETGIYSGSTLLSWHKAVVEFIKWYNQQPK